LPVIILSAPFGEPIERLIADSEKELNFSNYLKGSEEHLGDAYLRVEEVAGASREELYLRTWYGDSEEDGNGFFLELFIVAKGDFNKDGYSDYLVYFVKAANRGFWFDTGFILLTSKDESNKLYDVYGSDFVCEYKDKKYVCSDPSKGKPPSAWSPFE
jgi:hypothetical protein